MTDKNKADTSNMGRWTSVLLRGKKSIRLHLVSVYFATSKKEHGKRKTFMQHKLVLLRVNRKQSVYQAFWEDFWEQINKWMEAGE